MLCEIEVRSPDAIEGARYGTCSPWEVANRFQLCEATFEEGFANSWV